MWQTSIAFASGAFAGGYGFRSLCGGPGCQARLSDCSDTGKIFKLSVVVHSATLSDVEGGGLITNQRPLIGVSVRDRSKETELGDWSKEKSEWCFQEAIVLSVSSGDELCVYVSCSRSYNLFLAAVSLTVTRIGELSLRVSDILSHLRMEILRERVFMDDPDIVSVEDRGTDSPVYTTPVLPLDVVSGGKRVGCLNLSFETQNRPSERSNSMGCGLQACAAEERARMGRPSERSNSTGLITALPSNARALAEHVEFRTLAPRPIPEHGDRAAVDRDCPG